MWLPDAGQGCHCRAAMLPQIIPDIWDSKSEYKVKTLEGAEETVLTLE